VSVRPKHCEGGFPFGYKCSNVAGCPHTPYWCFNCNEKRMAHIDGCLDRINRQIASLAPRQSGEQK
jgi:hypothetical protein